MPTASPAHMSASLRGSCGRARRRTRPHGPARLTRLVRPSLTRGAIPLRHLGADDGEGSRLGRASAASSMGASMGEASHLGAEARAPLPASGPHTS